MRLVVDEFYPQTSGQSIYVRLSAVETNVRLSVVETFSSRDLGTKNPIPKSKNLTIQGSKNPTIQQSN